MCKKERWNERERKIEGEPKSTRKSNLEDEALFLLLVDTCESFFGIRCACNCVCVCVSEKHLQRDNVNDHLEHERVGVAQLLSNSPRPAQWLSNCEVTYLQTTRVDKIK